MRPEIGVDGREVVGWKAEKEEWWVKMVIKASVEQLTDPSN
jgi:hypothetical protein